MEIKKINILKILIAAFAIVCLSGQAAFADAPVANNDTATVAEDSVGSVIDVLFNDTDAEGDPLSVSSVTQGSNGSVTNNGTDVSYTPDANYFGVDSFTYTISDGNGGTDTATVSVTVTSVNDNPDAVDDTATVAEDSVGSVIDVLFNDTDDESDPLSVSSVTQGSNGSVTNNGTDVSYTPDANYFGVDSFTYTISDGNGGTDTATVSVTVTSVNDNPDAIDDTATVAEDSVGSVIDVLFNDTDDESDPLSVSSVTQGSNGSVTNNGTDVSYTPDANYFGVDSFTYTISDGNGGTDTATVTVTVTSVNDTPDAVDDTATVVEDSGSNDIDVLSNDTDTEGDTLTITGVTQGSNGSVTNNGTDVSYTPDADYFGNDSFTYTISDGNGGTDTGTVSVTVTNVNDIPNAVDDATIVNEDSGVNIINVLSNDTDADSDTLTITGVTQGSNGSVTNNGTNVSYTPNANYFGADSFTYTISDGNGGTDTATVTVTVTSVNDNPDAVDDTATVVEDSGSTDIDVLSNDTDTEGDPLTITGVTQGSNGSVTNNGINVSYTPDADYFGVDSFTYTIDDGNGGTDTATVSVTVTNVNDNPVANDDIATVAEDSGANGIDVLGNDTDADPIDTLLVTVVTQGTNGAVVITGGGTGLTYAPDANYFGSDSFTYTIDDGNGSTDTATVNVTVTSVNDVPVADFSGTPLIIVEGEGANFTDLSTDVENSIVDWSWDFGDGSAPDTAQNTTHLYSIPGTYTVSLTVTDIDGATDTETKTGYIWVKALYDLTITWTGTGSGDVTAGAGAPSGYPGGTLPGSAGSSVQYTYVEGDAVALSALAALPPPGLGSIFKGFSGDAAGMAPTITMDGDKSVTAEFAQTWEILATAGANGTISPSGSVQVEEGSDQTFTIDPDTCYEIFGVSVDGFPLDPPVTQYTFTNVTENHTIDAAFIEYDCIITATAEYGGTMLPVGTMIVSCGSSQTFTITPAAGNVVEDVLVDGVSVGAVTSHTLSNIEKDDPDGFGACSHSIVAKFTRLPAACMEISDIPLTTLINSAPANILFVMDDSGSMDFEVMTTEDDGLFHTKTADIEYLFDMADNMFWVGVNSNILLNDDRKLWKSQWIGINKVYYDPTVYYEPWASLTDAPVNNPWSQPMYNNVGDPAIDLSGTYVSIDAGIVVDNLDGAPYFTTTGTWNESDIAPEHDGSSVQTTSEGDTATFTPNMPTAGNYDVYAWWNCYNDRDENAEITIVDSAGTHTVYRDQRSDDKKYDCCAQWIPLGTYSFAAGTSGSVTIGRHALSTGSSTVADAVKFVKSGLSIDIKNAHYYIWSASIGKPYLVVVDGGNIDYYAVDDSDSDDMIEDGELTIVGSPPDDVIPKNESGTPRTYLEERQNFANWFSYYRRRDLVARMAIGKVITEMSGVNIGFRAINEGLIQPVLKVKVEGEDNTSDLLNALYSYRLNADRSATPLRRGLEFVGQYFDQDDGVDGGVGPCPIASAEEGGECQQNFAVVFTDGYYNGLAPVKVGNEDGDNGPPYADSQPGTLADTAMMYYENDLADNLDNLVPANQWDDATYQHLVTYGITFGVHGTLNPDDYDVENCIDGTEADCPPWPEPINLPIERVDDLWHAAVNGRGLFLSASNPQELIAAFLAVMENIVLRIGSASSVSVNGDELYTKLSGNILMYQSNYDSDGWVGDVKAYQVCTDLTGNCAGKEIGDVITSSYAWSANEKVGHLDWNTDRKIVTYNGTDAGTAFRWDDLTVDQQTALNNDSTLLDYLRGDTNNEKANGGTFRDRFARLGDIVHSSPVFENGVLYAGGNDGMLHAFAAADGEPYAGVVGGEELFAYVPDLIFNKLSQLADPAYAHKYFVDLTPTVQAGVDISGNITTVLVGGLGHGGKGYYALDVTDPESWTSEGAIDGKVMWEYPKAGVMDDDMGYSYSKPVIVKSMDSSVGSNGWIVIFGNGYNSQNGHAVLYILNPGTGAIIKTIDTGVDGCNGLSSPVPIDVDYDDMVDYVYAGDLRGNVWKFDLADTDYTNWEVAFYGGEEKPLFQAQGPGGTTQPITTKPDVMYHPKEHGYMVVFGTGQFLGEPDFSSTTVQSFYGIWDYGDDEDDGEYLGSFNRGFGHELSNQPSTVTLLGQQVIPSEAPDPNAPDFWTVTINEGQADEYDLPLRLTTNNEIVWETMIDTDGNQNPDLSDSIDNHAGWFFDLPLSGEKGTVDVMLRNGNAIAISYKPDDVPCSAGGNSVIHEFSAESGARLTRSQFDINGDGVVDENDMINIGTDENPIWVVPTGIQMPGQIQPPAILIDPDTGLEVKYLSSSSGTIEKVKEKAALVGITHWREFE